MVLHHIELWLAEAPADLDDWAWLLAALGYRRTASWSEGETWSDGGAYLTLTSSPNLRDAPHERRRPGVNHLAFAVPDRGTADRIVSDAEAHGWTPLYADRYPHAGGPDSYAGWLENGAGHKVEIVVAG